jgi:hypothetical protein
VIQGQSVAIASNLYIALQNLRHVYRPRILWIDAVCINQECVAERNAQVKLMPQIYSGAQRVLIWLGERSDKSHTAFKVVRRLHTSMYQSSADRDLLYLTDEDRDALSETFKKSKWWHRLWCVQEFVYAKSAVLVCGDEAFMWDLLPLKYHFSTLKGMVGYTGAHEFWDVDALATFKANFDDVACHPADRLAQLLESFQYKECSDPRDRIFAISSLDPSSHALLEPDYNLTVSEVSLQATKAMVLESSNLDVLAFNYKIEIERGFLSLETATALVRNSLQEF